MRDGGTEGRRDGSDLRLGTEAGVDEGLQLLLIGFAADGVEEKRVSKVYQPHLRRDSDILLPIMQGREKRRGYEDASMKHPRGWEGPSGCGQRGGAEGSGMERHCASAE